MIKTKRYLVVIVFLLIAEFSALAQPFGIIKDIAQRRVPWLASKVEFYQINASDSLDIFEIESYNDHLKIGASNANAAAVGLRWYLKYYCRRSMSHVGDNFSPLSSLPSTNGIIRKQAEFPLRYALNYCTVNYTMSFYRWEDWERELDWMALNGVNLMLMPVGTEAVWQQTLKRLNFTTAEIAAFIPGPAFTAWWLMGNLEGWGGPMSQNMIDQQAMLAKKILKRMRELGIEPVMQGFYGIVPTTLKKKQKVNIVAQGKWAGGFTRPDFLLPDDTAFKKIAGIYYEEMQRLYGTNIQYFGGDPFHEGGNTAGVDVPGAAGAIQRVMQQYYPDANWILQGWGKNPSSELLKGIDKSSTIVIDLFGENSRTWEERKAYEHTPFIWSNVSNFGEKAGLYGKLQRFASEVYYAKRSPYHSWLKGIGIIPEGINNNPVAYELMLELAWEKDSVDVSRWIRDFVTARYGVNNEKLQAAWQGLLQTVYSSFAAHQEGPSESIFCARPDTGLQSVSSWGTLKRNYDLPRFEAAVLLFLQAEKEVAFTETYQADKIDMIRQVQANRAGFVYQDMMHAIDRNDATQFRKSYRRFEKMLLQQDSLLGSSRYFTLYHWLKQAEDFGATKNEKRLSIQNAKTQISYWGSDNPKTDLHDYANKEWNGMLSSLYLHRWRMFSDMTISRMRGRKKTGGFYAIEKKWADRPDMYKPTALTPKQQDELIKRILTK